jgi:hypothetical protein
MKNNWFWTAFSAWIFLGVTVTAWPLIYSPFHLKKIKISAFDIETNGVKQQHQMWVSSSPIKLYETELKTEWGKDGWRQITGNLDLTPYLLGLEKHEIFLLDYLRVRVFRKNNFLKILGLWNNLKKDQTYCWIAELPITGFDNQQNLPTYSFPLSPPSNTLDIYSGKVKNLQFACWTLPLHSYPEEKFREIFSSQGFKGRLWNRRPAETIYLLEKGPVRIIAALKSEGTKEAISLVLFDKK